MEVIARMPPGASLEGQRWDGRNLGVSEKTAGRRFHPVTEFRERDICLARADRDPGQELGPRGSRRTGPIPQAFLTSLAQPSGPTLGFLGR